MTLRRVVIAAAVVTLLTSGAYVFVYLYRWEWNRALVSGVIFLAAEVALVSAVLTARLNKVDRRLDALAMAETERVRRHLREHTPPSRVTFSWLTRTDRSAAGQTAPAEGLFLEDVEYG